jgi:hypothetical protein
VSTRFQLDADDLPIARTLTYIVAVSCREPDGIVGWTELCDVHWRGLEMDWEYVLMELATSMARREAGDPCIEIVRPEQ